MTDSPAVPDRLISVVEDFFRRQCAQGHESDGHRFDIHCGTVSLNLTHHLHENGFDDCHRIYWRLVDPDDRDERVDHSIVQVTTAGSSEWIVDPTIVQFYLPLPGGVVDEIERMWAGGKKLVFPGEDPNPIFVHRFLRFRADASKTFAANLGRRPFFLGEKRQHPLVKLLKDELLMKDN